MLKFKNRTTGNQLCFKSSLNSCRNLHFLNFIDRLFHKTLPRRFNDYIPYFRVITFEIEMEILLLSEYGIFLSLYVFQMKPMG